MTIQWMWYILIICWNLICTIHIQSLSKSEIPSCILILLVRQWCWFKEKGDWFCPDCVMDLWGRGVRWVGEYLHYHALSLLSVFQGALYSSCVDVIERLAASMNSCDTGVTWNVCVWEVLQYVWRKVSVWNASTALLYSLPSVPLSYFLHLYFWISVFLSLTYGILK